MTAAAAALRVSRPALSSLLNAKADLSGEMALRIEKAFGVKMDTLMRMQSAYDIAKTRKREKEIRIRRIHRPAAAGEQVNRACIERLDEPMQVIRVLLGRRRAGRIGLHAALRAAGVVGNDGAVREVAAERAESRGCHVRTDYPGRNDGSWQRSIPVRLDAAGRPFLFERALLRGVA